MVDAESDVSNCLSIVDFEVQIVSVTWLLLSGFFFCLCLPICAIVHVFILFICPSCFILGFHLVVFCICCMIFLPANYMQTIPCFQQVILGFGDPFNKVLCCHGFKTFSRYFIVVGSCILNSSFSYIWLPISSLSCLVGLPFLKSVNF